MTVDLTHSFQLFLRASLKKPLSEWMARSLGEDEANTEDRVELMACVVTAKSIDGNTVYVTNYQTVNERHGRGWPTPRFGQGRSSYLWWLHA